MYAKTFLIPAFVLAGGLLTGGAMIASAQDAGQPDGAGSRPPFVQVSDRDGPRGHGHGGRGGHGFGGPGGEVFRNLFTQIDTNKDGKVTQAEIDAYRAAQVSAADANKDGVLTIDEFQTAYDAFIRPQMVRAFQDFDTDGDGKITSAEIDAKVGAIVSRMDRNGDGSLTIDDRGPGGHG